MACCKEWWIGRLWDGLGVGLAIGSSIIELPLYNTPPISGLLPSEQGNISSLSLD